MNTPIKLRKRQNPERDVDDSNEFSLNLRTTLLFIKLLLLVYWSIYLIKVYFSMRIIFALNFASLRMNVIENIDELRTTEALFSKKKKKYGQLRLILILHSWTLHSFST